MKTLECEVNFAPPPPEDLEGTLRVRVVEVGRADADATVVAEDVVEHCVLGPRSDPPVVSLRVSEPRKPEMLALEAHFDIDGSGETSVGDYRTMEHFPLTDAMVKQSRRLAIQVRAVS